MRGRYRLTLLVLGLACPAWGAKEEPPKDGPAAQAQAAAERRQVAELASRYLVAEGDVRALRERKLGWGEVGHALSLSAKSGRPISEVMALRDSGMGWGKIARHYGVRLGEIKRRARDPGREPRGARRPDRLPGSGSPGRGPLGVWR